MVSSKPIAVLRNGDRILTSTHHSAHLDYLYVSLRHALRLGKGFIRLSKLEGACWPPMLTGATGGMVMWLFRIKTECCLLVASRSSALHEHLEAPITRSSHPIGHSKNWDGIGQRLMRALSTPLIVSISSSLCIVTL